MSKNKAVSNNWGAAGMLWFREILRFYRQPSRVAAAILSPVLFWFLIGSGVGRTFSSSGSSSHYLEYFFPGAILLVILFAAVFSTISIIEDRREGFLQAVMVAPVSRASIPLGKILGSTSLAFLQSALFMVLAMVMGMRLHGSQLAATVFAVLLSSFLLSTLGFLMAWQFRSIQGFHAVMNMLLMPMWFLSGAIFPDSGAAGWIRILMHLNPLFYGHRLLCSALAIPGTEAQAGWFSAAVMSVSVALLWIVAAIQVSKKSGMDV